MELFHIVTYLPREEIVHPASELLSLFLISDCPRGEGIELPLVVDVGHQIFLSPDALEAQLIVCRGLRVDEWLLVLAVIEAHLLEHALHALEVLPHEAGRMAEGDVVLAIHHEEELSVGLGLEHVLVDELE